jgi:hypothetical protein
MATSSVASGDLKMSQEQFELTWSLTNKFKEGNKLRETHLMSSMDNNLLKVSNEAFGLLRKGDWKTAELRVDWV